MHKFIINKKIINTNLIYWIIFGIIILLGILIRFKGLGKWTLALDEYYIVKSAENILKFGLPQFPEGGYYNRGILLQYFTSLLLTIGIKAEFASRILPVIANLATIPPVYLIAKRVGNKFIALMVVTIFSFSIWEIEFARFARMYTMFQAVFMWYIYFALLDVEKKDFSHFKWLLFLSALSIFVYEGSIFLVVFNFIPFIVSKKINWKYLFSSSVLFIFSFILNRFNFRLFGSGDIFPPEYSDLFLKLPKVLPIKIPAVLLPYSFYSLFTSVLSILIIIITFFLMYYLFSRIQKKSIFTYFSLITLGIFALLNQFGLFFLSFSIFIFWNFLDNNFLNIKNLVLIGTIFIINILYWYLFGILSNDWYVLFNDFSSYNIWGVSKRLFVAFFNYPDNYYTFLNYLKTLPILTLFSVLSLFILSIYLFKKYKIRKNLCFLFGSLIFLIFLSTIPKVPYQETRYTFFLVPLVIILVNISIFEVIKSFIGKDILAYLFYTILLLGVFYMSKDFSFYHLVNIDKEDVNYRLIYNNNIKKHLYRRWDVQNPINYIKMNFEKNDIIMINENSLEYYLPKVDYFNVDIKHEAFPILSVSQGTKERWSSAKLIYSNEDLLKFIRNRNKNIWFIVFPENWLSEINFYEKYKLYLEYQGIDGLLKVYKFPKL